MLCYPKVTAQLFPLVSFGAPTAELGSTQQYPLFMRTNPSDDVRAELICDFLIGQLNYSSTALVSVFWANPSGRNTAFYESLRSQCVNPRVPVLDGVPLEPFAFQVDAQPEIELAVQAFAKTRLRVAVAIADAAQTELILNSAQENEVIGSGFMWVLTTEPAGVRAPNQTATNASLFAALNGSIVVRSAAFPQTDNLRFDHFAKKNVVSWWCRDKCSTLLAATPGRR
jgi:hypothetical protein